MSRLSDGTDKPVPVKKKPVLLEDIEETQQFRTGADPQLATDLSGYPADPEFQLRGGFENLMLDAASPLFGLVIRRQVLRTGAPSSADRAMHHGLRLALFASVHETAVEIRVSEAARSGQPINPQRSGGQIARYLDQAWAEGLMQADNKQSDFYKVRAAGLICLIEGMLMAFKARELPDSDARIKTELLAAAMTTAAAGFEIGASYVDQVVTRYGANSVTGKGAAATLGRLKLWGAGLAGIGGSLLAWWDFTDSVEHFNSSQSDATQRAQKNSRLLAATYFVRGMATITLSLAELGTAVAIAKPLFRLPFS